VFGRHAEVRELALREGLAGLPVELTVEGLLDDALVAQRMHSCDVLLFVRGGISSRRGSAIAGIACGLPVIASESSETAPPITEAGVILLPPREDSGVYQQKMNEALLRVLSDSALRGELAAKSRMAYQDHFSWHAIAARFAAVLESESSTNSLS
jgi:glycosyltransferase involved in cell wall biosynthesis